jgi:hypothetical protein
LRNFPAIDEDLVVVVQLDLHAIDVDGEPLCAGGILALAALDKQGFFSYYFFTHWA